MKTRVVHRYKGKYISLAKYKQLQNLKGPHRYLSSQVQSLLSPVYRAFKFYQYKGRRVSKARYEQLKHLRGPDKYAKVRIRKKLEQPAKWRQIRKKLRKPPIKPGKPRIMGPPEVLKPLEPPVKPRKPPMSFEEALALDRARREEERGRRRKARAADLIRREAEDIAQQVAADASAEDEDPGDVVRRNYAMEDLPLGYGYDDIAQMAEGYMESLDEWDYYLDIDVDDVEDVADHYEQARR